MVNVKELRRRHPAAWTALLTEKTKFGGVIVNAVSEERLRGSNSLTRYILALDGYQEPITLIGKQTTTTEAQFYRYVASEVSFLVPNCWFSHISQDRAWIVIDEAYDDWPAWKWTSHDVEDVVENLANLHKGFWEQTALLEQLGWRPMLSVSEETTSEVGDEAESTSGFDNWLKLPHQRSRINNWKTSHLTGLSEHAVRSAGSLVPTLLRAAEGLEELKARGGWPGVLDEHHLQAMADLLDDPLPMLHPLRQLPETLIHGNPATEHWYLNMFGQYRLLDWETVAVGPGIYDLVSFIEQFDLIRKANDSLEQRDRWPVTEETMEDSYLLAMGSKLGTHYNAMTNRQAIPAARCLFVLTTWLPRIAEWLWQTPRFGDDWIESFQRNIRNSNAAGSLPLAQLRSHLSSVFDRFLRAYRAL